MVCGKTDVKLDAHHITNRNELPKGGYVKSNGITLCNTDLTGCHFKVEEFYFSPQRETDSKNRFHPDNLYKIIGSSYAKALEDSSKL